MRCEDFVFVFTNLISCCFSFVLVFKMTGSEGNSSMNPPRDLQMEALERMFRRIVNETFEPLASRMDKIDGGGSQSVHDEVHGENDTEHSPRQHTPRPG